MNKNIIVLLLVLFLYSSPMVIAQNQEEILASEKMEFGNDKYLIEWFSSTECIQCRQFGNQNLNSDYIWINWFNSTSDPLNNLARKDTDNRINQLNTTELPFLAVDGKIINLNHEDGLSKWNDILFDEINRSSKVEKVNFSLSIDLIDSDGDHKADSIKLSGNITPLNDLHNNTEIQIHLLQERDDPDDSGARTHINNVLKEWVPRMDFSVQKGNSTNWDYTLTETHLESAGVDLNEGDSNRYKLIVSIHGDDTESPANMKVLTVNSMSLPSLKESQTWGALPIILLADLIIFVGLIFIIYQERIRERGLPLIKGKIIFTKNGERKVDLEIKTGNKKVEVISIETSKSWRTSRIGKLPIISPESSHNIQFKVHPKQQNNNKPIQIIVKSDIEDLGQWMMDIDIINDQINKNSD